MNKFKKLTAFIISIMMLISFVPAGAFNIAEDVAGTDYEESAYVLGALGIMVGDKDTGNFRPKDNIKRSEFARVAVSLLGMDDIAEASKEVSKFSDVPVTHWANGYINVATSQKLVIGKDNNLFDPDSFITYEEAVTILVRALGYEPSANAKGGYPAGFLAVAAQTGLSKNAASNPSLPVKRGIVANLTNNSLTIKMMEQTGFGANASFEVVDKTILEEKLDVIKDKGQITANGFSTLESGSNLEKDEIRIGEETFSVGKSGAEGFLGYYVTYYARKNDDKVNKEILLVRPEKGRNKKVKIDGEDIVKATDSELSYNDDKDKKDDKKIKLSNDLKMIYNGVGKEKDLSVVTNKLQGAVSALEVTGDDKYDILFVDEVKNIVVEDVFETAHKVSDKFGNPGLTLDPDDDSYNFTLANHKNDKIELKDLKEWDVLSYTKSKDNKYIRVWQVKNTVTGKITEISDNEYVIDNKSYKKANNFETTLKLGDEGIFHLDIFGKIAAVNKKTSMDRNYAYLINAGLDGAIDKSAIFKILDMKGDIKTLNSEDKIKFNGVSGTKSEDVINKLQGAKAIEKQLIAIKTNEKNLITEIETAEDKSKDDFTIDKYKFIKNFEDTGVTYKKASEKLGKFNITDETIVFDIPASSDDYNDYTVRDKKMFENDSKYNVSIFDVTEDLNAKVVIVTNSDGKTNNESPLAVVNKITSARNEDGEEIEKLYVAYNGEMKSFETESTGILVKGEAKELKKLEAGDIIQFKLNAKDKIEKIELIFDISNKNTEFSKTVGEKMALVYGKVTKKFSNSLNISVNDGVSENYSLKDVKVINIDTTKNSNKISIVTTADIERYDEENPSRVLLRSYDDVVKEVIIIK